MSARPVFSCCFFFSSRRRHTRSLRDWSSDVCSSDLVREALQGCDLVLVIVDAAKKTDADRGFLFSILKHTDTPAFLLLNKIDLLRGGKAKLLPIIEQGSKLHQFREVIPISARRREGLDLLI